MKGQPIPGIDHEIQLQFEKDAAAYAALSPRLQKLARGVGNAFYNLHQGVGISLRWLMKPFDIGFEYLFRKPFMAVKSLFPRRAATVPAAPKNGLWQKIKKGIGKVSSKIGDFLAWHGAIGLYRLTAWLLDPRLKNGEPLLKNQFLNRTVKTLSSITAFAVMSAVFFGIEILVKVGHVQAGNLLAKSSLSGILQVGQHVGFHGLLALTAAAAQFVLVPTIAAARHTLKDFKLVQGAAYHYNSRLKARTPPPSATHWQPSSSVINFCKAVLEKMQPEFYKAKIKHYEARFAKRKQTPEAATAPIIVNTSIAGKSDLANATVRPAFNDNAPNTARPSVKKPAPRYNHTPKL